MRKGKANTGGGHTVAALEAAPEFSEREEQALAEFGRWLDGELEQLVARWVHLAAPNASRRAHALRRTI
ncbi:MAG TPA: hypothetical protein VHD36_05455 [Pirellulales bacterium]|nr:hypothetical protein [Pirellulales bacterium]